VSILGSGMAGFGAWHRLQRERHDVVLYDKNLYPGGHTFTWVDPRGFLFDEGPHVSFTSDDAIREILADAVDDAYEELPYELDNYWHGFRLSHPAQCHLHGLPADVITEIVADFVEQSAEPPRPVENYYDWLIQAYGKTFADRFPVVYTTKYHTTHPRNMTTDWIGPRMYRPSLEEVLLGALAPAPPAVHYIKGFRYPSEGGFASYLEKFARDARIELGHEAVEIDPSAKSIRFGDGTTTGYERLISSLPLPDLIRIISGAPADVREAAERLACSNCVLVNVGIGRPDVTDKHITYVYDEDIVFSRLSFPHLMSPANAPAGMSSVQAECYFSDKYHPLDVAPEELIEPTLRDLRRIGVLREDDEIVMAEAIHLTYANVIYDVDRNPALDCIHGFLDEIGIARCGRYGDWGHIWTDEAFLSGVRAAESVI
jgi:protoporphyrinogen oxidase